jgi:hypothetical protein
MVGFHRGLNRETAENWGHFQSHRRRVTDLITGLAGSEPAGELAGDLAILGAGNGNDLALDEIVPRFQRVHLIDIDREAIERARDRQSPEVAQRLQLHAPVDLGGGLGEVGKFRRRTATPAELGALPGAATRAALAAVPQRFQAVASTCLLSQLVHGCQQLLGDDHAQIQEIACAVVVAHLRVLGQLLVPGGRALLITDMVSSDTYPLEELWSQRSPWGLVAELETSGNHLSGTTPKFLRRIVNTDPVIAPLTGLVELETPWLWALSDEETYLVYALRFTRVADGQEGEK